MRSYIFTNRNLIERNRDNGIIKIVLLFTLLFAGITVFVQLLVMSEYATKGEEIAKLEEKKERLSIENLQLKKQIAEASSLEYIHNKAKDSGYVALEQNDIRYVMLD